LVLHDATSHYIYTHKQTLFSARTRVCIKYYNDYPPVIIIKYTVSGFNSVEMDFIIVASKCSWDSCGVYKVHYSSYIDMKIIKSTTRKCVAYNIFVQQYNVCTVKSFRFPIHRISSGILDYSHLGKLILSRFWRIPIGYTYTQHKPHGPRLTSDHWSFWYSMTKYFPE